MRTLRYVLIAITAIGCSQRGATPPPAASAPTSSANFELDCGSTNTTNAAQLQCVRTDTRTGDVQVIDYMRLPVSNGPTATGAAAPGRFTTVCDATTTTARSDFYCLRMNTETGELLLVNLTKVGVLPPKPQ